MAFVIIKSDIDYIIYTNIGAFAAARGYKLKDESYPMTEDAFIAKRDGYLVVNGEGVSFLLIATGSEYNKKDKLSRAIAKTGAGKLFIIKSDSMKIRNVEHPNYEIINGNTYLIKDHTKDLLSKGRTVRLQSTDEEWEVMEDVFVVERNNLPKIDRACHEVVWKGFKPGDVVYTESPSLSSNGTYSCYRVVA